MLGPRDGFLWSSVATQTRKLTAVTHRTGRLVEIRLTAGMQVNPIPGVIGGLQSSILYVAFPATEWRVDLVMTNQTISHPREGGIRHTLRLVKSAVAGHTEIASIEMPPRVAGVR
jgi:hypothetical protein